MGIILATRNPTGCFNLCVLEVTSECKYQMSERLMFILVPLFKYFAVGNYC